MVSTKECIFCKDDIAVNSKKCPHCGQLQSGNKNYFIALAAVLVFDILVLVIGNSVFHNLNGSFASISALLTGRGASKKIDVSEDLIAMYEAMGYSRKEAKELLSASQEIGEAASQEVYDYLGITGEDASQLAASVLDSLWGSDDSANTASGSSQNTSNSSKYNIAYSTIPRESFAVLEKMLVGDNFWDLLDTDGSFMNPAVYLGNWTSDKNITPAASIPKNAKNPSSCTLEEIYLNLYLKAAAEEITSYTDDFSYSDPYLPWEYSAYSIITELKKDQKGLDHFIDSYILFANQGVSPEYIRAAYAEFDQYAAMYTIDDMLQLNFGFGTKNLPVWWLSTKRKFLTSDCL